MVFQTGKFPIHFQVNASIKLLDNMTDPVQFRVHGESLSGFELTSWTDAHLFDATSVRSIVVIC